MGLFRGLLGHASEVDVTSVMPDVKHLLIQGEEVHYAYKLVRDLIVFTNLRLFTIDKQGLTGKKRKILSLSYDRITYFTMEGAGHFDLDAEIDIWVTGKQDPIRFEFRKGGHVQDVFRILSHYTLGGSY